MKYRIDIQRDGRWEPGQITFHDQTPLQALEDISARFQTVIHRPVRIVKVYETHRAYVEIVRTFDDVTEGVTS
jgi:hypothetical protein